VVLGDNMARMDELTGRGAFDRDELAARFTRLMVEGFRTRG
jgi:hypothetical protein